jgi:hypothetical protein
VKICIIDRNGFGGGDRNNEEHGGQRSGGFDSNRGGFSDRGSKSYTLLEILKYERFP